jgi:hypothetical protein
MQQDEYVSSKDGMRILGVDSGKFFYYVQSGQISKEPNGRKRNNRYSIADINRVKEKLSKKQYKNKVSQSQHGYVDWIADINDVLTSLKLDYTVYKEDVELADLSYYTERVKRNPHVALAVYDSPKKETMYAYISLLPVAEQIILEVLSGKKQETDIRTEDIETYDRAGAFTLLAESVVVHPDYQNVLNTLLHHLLEYWYDQYPERYISKIYAQAASNKGDILIQKLYFAPLYHLSKNAYMLDLERPGASRFVRHFQERLKEKGWQLPEAI